MVRPPAAHVPDNLRSRERDAQLDAPDEVTLYRFVGHNEARDIEDFGGFRSHPASFEEGKWFATTFEDAVRCGHRMPPISLARRFRVASVRVPASSLAACEFCARLDGIGPAYFVRRDQLNTLNATGTVRLDSREFEKGSRYERAE
jgi:hypothetical protein